MYVTWNKVEDRGCVLPVGNICGYVVLCARSDT